MSAPVKFPRPTILARSGASLAAGIAVAAALAGCQALGGALGGGGGVMPAGDVGPPPSLRSGLPGREARVASVDADGQPLPSTQTRRLDLPKDKRGEARASSEGARRIRRDEIEGETASGSAAGGMQPSLTPGGSVGLGGKF